MPERPKNIVRVYRPELTEEERARRMETIKQAVINLAIAMERSKRNAKHS